MQTSKSDWQSFFHGAHIVVDAVANADRLLQLKLGSRFNVFDFIRPDENTLSDLLRDLLDPLGTHGQGSTFLKLALEHFLQTPDDLTANALERCAVVREAPTADGRFIDLVLNFGSCGIGVENKPFAAEQKEQLADYADHLDRQFQGSFCLIFLHGPGMAPKSLSVVRRNSLKAQGRFVEIPYYANSGISLHDWLTRSAGAAMSEKVRFFLIDFAAYVAGRFPY